MFSIDDAGRRGPRAEAPAPAKPGGVKSLQKRVTHAAKTYPSRGNTAVDPDWAEF